MPALTQARNTPKYSTNTVSDRLAIPVKANTRIWQGALVVFDAGFAAPARVATGLVAVGVAESTVDNLGGGGGALQVSIRRGAFIWANSSAIDQITQADCGKTAFIVDDNTVAKTDGGATRSAAGKILAVSPAGVTVETI